MSGREARFTRCYALSTRTGKGGTYAEEAGEELQGLGCGVVNVAPVVGGHAGRTLLRRPVVEEVGQQLGRPPRAVETLVEKSGELWIRQQSLI